MSSVQQPLKLPRRTGNRPSSASLNTTVSPLGHRAYRTDLEVQNYGARPLSETYGKKPVASAIISGGSSDVVSSISMMRPVSSNAKMSNNNKDIHSITRKAAPSVRQRPSSVQLNSSSGNIVSHGSSVINEVRNENNSNAYISDDDDDDVEEGDEDLQSLNEEAVRKLGEYSTVVEVNPVTPTIASSSVQEVQEMTKKTESSSLTTAVTSTSTILNKPDALDDSNNNNNVTIDADTATAIATNLTSTVSTLSSSLSFKKKIAKYTTESAEEHRNYLRSFLAGIPKYGDVVNTAAATKKHAKPIMLSNTISGKQLTTKDLVVGLGFDPVVSGTVLAPATDMDSLSFTSKTANIAKEKDNERVSLFSDNNNNEQLVCITVEDTPCVQMLEQLYAQSVVSDRSSNVPVSVQHLDLEAVLREAPPTSSTAMTVIHGIYAPLQSRSVQVKQKSSKANSTCLDLMYHGPQGDLFAQFTKSKLEDLDRDGDYPVFEKQLAAMSKSEVVVLAYRGMNGCVRQIRSQEKTNNQLLRQQELYKTLEEELQFSKTKADKETSNVKRLRDELSKLSAQLKVTSGELHETRQLMAGMQSASSVSSSIVEASRALERQDDNLSQKHAFSHANAHRRETLLRQRVAALELRQEELETHNRLYLETSSLLCAKVASLGLDVSHLLQEPTNRNSMEYIDMVSTHVTNQLTSWTKDQRVLLRHTQKPTDVYTRLFQAPTVASQHQQNKK